jgi:excisionase family DNA binding protein
MTDGRRPNSIDRIRRSPQRAGLANSPHAGGCFPFPPEQLPELGSRRTSELTCSGDGPICFNSVKMTEPLLSLSETTLLLGCSAPTVRRHVAEGALPAYKLGDNTSPLRFKRRDIEWFLERHRVQPKVMA